MLAGNNSIVLTNQPFSDVSFKETNDENSVLEETFIDRLEADNMHILNSYSGMLEDFQQMA